ncbi:MAG: discoidin domain-containing protein [Verrucomicrobiae bacterium]|nr:discoidin domain-containing protein [Verrucomicrobiae bacterium]
MAYMNVDCEKTEHERTGSDVLTMSKPWVLGWLVFALFALPYPASCEKAEQSSLALAGTWRFALDPDDVGIRQRWFSSNLAFRIKLPGILQAQGYGYEISTNTPWVLTLYDTNWFMRADYAAYTKPGNVKVPFLCQPPRHYLGPAWYQRDIEIPRAWQGRRVVVFLERVNWESRLWLNERLIGTNNSLCTPHVFELGVLAPGKYRLTVRVDNRMLLPYRPDAHSVSDSLGQSWNGIVGAIELRSTPPVWIDDLQCFPELNTKSVRAVVKIGNITGATATNTLMLGLMSMVDSMPIRPDWVSNLVIPPSGLELTAKVTHDLKLIPWDEFCPAWYWVAANLGAGPGNGKHYVRATIGFREFRAHGTEFIFNGRPAHLRGTHHGGDFPLTGHPPCDIEYWRKLLKTCKDWGLNHVRFHSFCPPEAAFAAADELGVYLQIEPGMWNTFNPDSPMEQMLYAETERIIKHYGNHPSFVLFSASNEPKGRWRDVLPQWAAYFRARDPRRLYTTGTGFTDPDAPGPLDRVDFSVTQRFGPRRVRGEPGWFGRDYRNAMYNVTVPVVAHELGQWCAYPDFDVIKKFTGYLCPGNFEIFRDSAGANYVLAMNKPFARASGRFQLACYKEEIEANLRTPGLAGFQLLDLHDYIGQGTALVGVLDPFWEEKGYVTAREWRRFCSETVPLARLTNRVFTTTDKLEAEVEVAHFGRGPITNATVSWQILDSAGKPFAKGQFQPRTITLGRNTALGRIELELAQLPSPGAYKLVLSVRCAGAAASQTGRARSPDLGAGIVAENDWQFWVYPAHADDTVPPGVVLARTWDEAEAELAAGGKVLFVPRPADLDWFSPPLAEVPIFWNRLMNPQWSRMLGLWCDTNHPALANFPTADHCDWQWIELVRNARAVNIGKLPQQLKPIVAAIDDWNRNWRLAPIFEARVGRGKLLVCSFDIVTDVAARPVARQLRRSLLEYMASTKFAPKTEIEPAQIRSLLFDTLIMRKLRATATAPGSDPNAAIDGDPNTFWSTTDPIPELTVSFPQPVAMSGLVLMNRQNDRNHAGDIRAYKLEFSDDGQHWRELAHGELASTWNPQTVKFPQTVTARHLKLTRLAGFGADKSTALAELAVIYAGPKLTDTSGDKLEYRRVRSSTPDIDEANPPAPSGN